MPVELKLKNSSSTKSAKRRSKRDSSRNKDTKKSVDNDGQCGSDTLPEPIRYLGGKQRTDFQRSKHHKHFEELTTVICASSHPLRALAATEASAANTAGRRGANPASVGPSPSSPAFSAYAFPILSVGYLARAMGLNVSNEQVASIVELIEEGGVSTGFVDKRKLEHVLVDALLTGTIGGSTLREFAVAAAASSEEANVGKLSLERLERFAPSLCARDSDATLLRAFEALDMGRKGYLELLDLQATLAAGGERFSSEEVDEMWMAMRDPETDRIYYRDFADVLARE
ncbi:hypothetical protein ABB37_07569 [Leptomonas pyrrhocoris]|uniref:EF-hand domain-containing protein n=1 Tax=Leptomonas pyrrhocoris TaxID=157538 RepID=A0A0M9FVD0_LEPPY|nr:hypothetical protein ABB37_07569 [Leptomonas pyrrhocoris]KPA76739.1 hypothetical protein ABB37_07569 [Leptomonas pyrrhocoris]|eukprot:XP_015655178.1 hypothetical protein ABB37_07569 [Leptomonas pyrrhocoris]